MNTSINDASTIGTIEPNLITTFTVVIINLYITIAIIF